MPKTSQSAFKLASSVVRAWRLPVRRQQPARVGVMTCVRNEVACVAFAVGSLVNHVDCYVLIDTGSNDGTVELIRDLYQAEIRSGRLVIEEIGLLPDHDMSIARNRALTLLRDAQIEYFIKVDGDTVFYDEGAQQIVGAVNLLHPRITHLRCPTHELYQFEIEGTAEWLYALKNRRDVFWEMSFLPDPPLVHAIEGAHAVGKWGDEQAGLRPEGIAYDRQEKHSTHKEVIAAHYGWARPLKNKREKLAAWKSPLGEDPRLDQLHRSNDWRRPTARFTRHPEVIGRKVSSVIEWVTRQSSNKNN